MISYHMTCYLRVITKDSVLYNFFSIYIVYILSVMSVFLFLFIINYYLWMYYEFTTGVQPR